MAWFNKIGNAHNCLTQIYFKILLNIAKIDYLQLRHNFTTLLIGLFIRNYCILLWLYTIWYIVENVCCIHNFAHIFMDTLFYATYLIIDGVCVFARHVIFSTWAYYPILYINIIYFINDFFWESDNRYSCRVW